MYIDLIVLLVVIFFVIMFFKRFSSFVFAIAIIDIFLRLSHLVANNIKIPEIRNLVFKYLPSSILDIVNNYVNGLFYIIVFWSYIVIMFIFLSYIIKIFLSKRKI